MGILCLPPDMHACACARAHTHTHLCTRTHMEGREEGIKETGPGDAHIGALGVVTRTPLAALFIIVKDGETPKCLPKESEKTPDDTFLRWKITQHLKLRSQSSRIRAQDGFIWESCLNEL